MDRTLVYPVTWEGMAVAGVRLGIFPPRSALLQHELDVASFPKRQHPNGTFCLEVLEKLLPDIQRLSGL